MDIKSLMDVINNRGIGAYYQGQDQALDVRKKNTDIENTLSQMRERMSKLGMEQELHPLRMQGAQAENSLRDAQTADYRQRTAEHQQTLPGRMAATEAATAATVQNTQDKQFDNVYGQLARMKGQLVGMPPEERMKMVKAVYDMHGQWKNNGTADPQFASWVQDPEAAYQGFVKNDPKFQQDLARDAERFRAQQQVEELRTQRMLEQERIRVKNKIEIAMAKAKSDPIAAYTDVAMEYGRLEAGLGFVSNEAQSAEIRQHMAILVNQAKMLEGPIKALAHTKAAGRLAGLPQLPGIQFTDPGAGINTSLTNQAGGGTQGQVQYQVGQVYPGRTGSYRYKGGDPAKSESWEKVK